MADYYVHAHIVRWKDVELEPVNHPIQASIGNPEDGSIGLMVVFPSLELLRATCGKDAKYFEVSTGEGSTARGWMGI